MSTHTPDNASAAKSCQPHPWEKAGLGKAPFRCTGVGREIYQAIPGDPNCPVQPGAACAYCGQGIYNVCYIRSADNQRFKVGIDCVRKLESARNHDLGSRDPTYQLMRAAQEKISRLEREKRDERNARKTGELTALLDRADVQDSLRAKPHPTAWRAEQGATLFDYVTWMLKNAGTKGKLQLLKQVKKEIGVEE
jgi:hypothetical protein